MSATPVWVHDRQWFLTALSKSKSGRLLIACDGALAPLSAGRRGARELLTEWIRACGTKA